jgi:AAHS family 4-hydroxybenzoate transporter-like MFS transporter
MDAPHGRDQPSETGSDPIDAAARINMSPMGGYQYRVVAICALVALLDGLDIQAMGLVIPALSEEWGVAPSSFGLVLSASFAGMMLGMMGLGMLGDRIGRRMVLLASFALVGMSSMATALATSQDMLMALRFLTGLGIGGCMPNATALTAEYVPAHRLAFFVTLMYSAVPLGGVVGGYVAGDLIRLFGWQAVFLAGGVIPLLLCFLILFALPESVRFLVGKPGNAARVGAILGRIDRSYAYAPGDSFTVPPSAGKGSVGQLFAEGRSASTLLLWTIFFFSLFGMYLLASWLPTILTQFGWPRDQAIRSVSHFWLGGILGGLAAGWLIDRFGPFKVLVPGFLVAAALTATMGLVDGTGWLVTFVILTTGFGVVGAQLAMTALAAELYPTAARSTGVGWGLGIGRLGAVISPAIGGLVLAAGWAQTELFAAAAMPALICAGGTLLMGLAERRRVAAGHSGR